MKLVKFALYTAGAVIGVLVLWLTVGGMIAENMLDAARGEWERENGSLAAFHERHPKVEKNGAARQLETLAAAVGINIRPRSEAAVISDDHPLVAEYRKAMLDLSSYIGQQLEKQSGPLDRVPPPIADFVRKHDRALDAVTAHLTTAPLPVWKFDADYSPLSDLPNLLGHMQLARLLSAKALLSLEEGRLDEAWQALHAVSRLSESLQPQPVLITQLISAAIGKIETLLARHMPAPVPAWQLAAPTRDRRRDFIDAVIGEQLALDTAARAALLMEAPRGSAARLAQLLAQPYATVCAANLWKVHRTLVADLERKDFCEIDGPTLTSAHFASIAEWNFLGRRFVPNYGSAIHRVREAELSEEMTDKILEAKMSRLASAGVWPQSIEGIDKSRCGERKWKYAVEANGSMTLSLDKVWPAEQRGTIKTPFTYSAQ